MGRRFVLSYFHWISFIRTIEHWKILDLIQGCLQTQQKSRMHTLRMFSECVLQRPDIEVYFLFNISLSLCCLLAFYEGSVVSLSVVYWHFMKDQSNSFLHCYQKNLIINWSNAIKLSPWQIKMSPNSLNGPLFYPLLVLICATSAGQPPKLDKGARCRRPTYQHQGVTVWVDHL